VLWFKKKEEIKEKAWAYVNKLGSNNYITESMKGLVTTRKIKFPVELGDEHPFDFSICERLCIKYGIVSAIVDKHIDWIMSSGINVKCKNEKAKVIIEQFMIDFNFDTLLRQYLREALIKGNGFLELGYAEKESIEDMKILDANYMYVNRDVMGVIEGYNQYSKALKDWTNFKEMMSKKDITSFEVKEIVHLPINIYGGDAYGYGIIYQLISIINDLVGSRKEMHTLMRRKANNPLIFLMGDMEKGEVPTPEEMEALGQKLEVMHNQTEWTLSAAIKPMVLDFGNISDKFAFIIENDMEVLYMAAQVPAILMGKASVAEGLGTAQLKAWQHRINSLREDVEKVIENDIFKRVLHANGIDDHVEIVWGMPSDEEKNEKAKIIISALQNPFMNEGLRAGMEGELAKIFEIDEDLLETANEERKYEEEQQTQPVIPAEKESFEKGELISEGWVTKDGKHIFIDDETGEVYSGTKAKAVSDASKVDYKANGRVAFTDSKIKIAKEEGYSKEVNEFNDVLTDYSATGSDNSRNKIKALVDSNSDSMLFDKRVTQSRLKAENNSDTVKLYRGVNSDESDSSRKGNIVSWTEDHETALLFSTTKNSKVLTKKVKIKDIVASSVTHNGLETTEYEYLVYEK